MCSIASRVCRSAAQSLLKRSGSLDYRCTVDIGKNVFSGTHAVHGGYYLAIGNAHNEGDVIHVDEGFLCTLLGHLLHGVVQSRQVLLGEVQLTAFQPLYCVAGEAYLSRLLPCCVQGTGKG